ncbi:MAG TPA: hypothetical protein EYP63_00600 [Desulfotomaculum sp.]|nr:hypothetical protein [Desulfotomaculum sp.]
MPRLWEQIERLRAIVDTARAQDVEREPEAVRTRYEPYAESYFRIEAVKRLEQRLIHALQDGRSITGYLSADFGYGKTATAVYLWKRCLDSELVAVPPFLFRQLKDVMQATYGWLAYQLEQTYPSLIRRLEEAYQRHNVRSTEELVEAIARREGISEAKARRIVDEYIRRYKDVTTAEALLDFLREAAGIALEAGFKGLVVFADESQEFIRTEDAGARDAVQTLSELVKGVRALAETPLGFMLAMPVNPTETAIEEQAGDIMQRMRERGAALRLEDAYGSGFPKELWEYLCDRFGGERIKRAVEERTLEALGQLCERKDLSNGPRTVISAFKRIAQRYQESGVPYTPIDLMDDYLQGHIVFEGREAKVTGALQSLLAHPSVQGDVRRQQAVKLLTAFPRGVDQAKAGELYQVIEDLAHKELWLGEHLTQLTEGYALVRLGLDGPPRPLLEEIVRDFRRRWHQVWSEQTKERLAATGFVQEILPLLFPQRSPGQYAGFGGHADRRIENSGIAYCVLDGAFERLVSRFPNRKVCVSVSTNADGLSRFLPPEDIDLDFRFFLEVPGEPDAENRPARVVSANQDRRVDFHLNLKRTFGRQFPPDLTFLHDIMSPERTSAQVLLGLSMRMWGWLEEHPDTSEANRQMIEARRGMLHRFVLQLLLPDAEDQTRVTVTGVRVSGAGQRLVESVFEAKCGELYPSYRSLKVTREWKNLLRRYRDALSRRPLGERRGRVPFAATKRQVAQAFGWTHTVFESTSRTLRDMGLLKVHWGRGRGEESEAEVTFLEHPLEELLRTALKNEGEERSVSYSGQARRGKSIRVGRLKEIGRRYGYLSEEVDEAVELLILRQYVERGSDDTIHEFTGAVDANELAYQAQNLEVRLRSLGEYFGDEVRDYAQMLQEAREYLRTLQDEVALDAAQRKLHELEVRLEEFIKGKARQLANVLSGLEGELQRRRGELTPTELESPVNGSVDFVRLVDDNRKRLRSWYRDLQNKWLKLAEKAAGLHTQAPTVTDVHELNKVVETHKELDRLKENLEGKIESLRRYLNGLQCWRVVVAKASALRERLDPESSLRERLDDVTTKIMEDFAERRIEALLDWEQFEIQVNDVEAEIRNEENRKRNEFQQCKEDYERGLAKFLTQRMVQATFDPEDPEQSYQLLYQDVLRKLRDWVREQDGIAQQVQSEIEYLINERGINASEERLHAEQVVRELATAGGSLNLGLVKDWAEFQRYCGDLEKIRDTLRGVQEKLGRMRTQKEEPSEEEKGVLQVLSRQRCSLENLRRQVRSGNLSLENLFRLLLGLYRKGHLELEVYKRE